MESTQAMEVMRQLTARCKTMEVSENRRQADDYFELVFFNKDVFEWEQLFTEFLGTAIKNSEQPATPEALQLTKDYGGVGGDQSLFRKEFSDGAIVVMFWPWNDRERTTLKIIREKKRTDGPL